MRTRLLAEEMSTAALMAALALAAPMAHSADELPPADGVMRAVAERAEGESRYAEIVFELTDRRGKTRVQHTRAYEKHYGEEERSVIYYTDPTNIRGTAFLTWDYPDPDVDDDQWLYLPAMGKVRRISASDRGDYFLGTDLTYEDIKNESKLPLADYDFETVGRGSVAGVDCVVVAAEPVNRGTAEELGYGRVRVWVDPATDTIRKGEYWDVAGNRLKTVRSRNIRKVDGYWTVHRIEVDNHKTGHATVLDFDAVDYGREVADRLFTRAALRRGRY